MPADGKLLNMSTTTIHLASGRSVSFEIEDRSGRPALFVLGVRKSGSSVLNAICTALAAHNDYQYADIAGAFFGHNVLVRDWANDPAINTLLKSGNVFGGFREFPPILQSSALFRAAPKVLLVRDPRDALVSEYFSNAYSHTIPEARDGNGDVNELMQKFRTETLATSVEDSVLRQARHMARTLVQFAPMCDDENCTIMKYEDVVLNKRKMIALICQRFGWTADENLVAAILNWADVMPEKENPTAFVRQVTPGDHRNKLSLPAIEQLNEILREGMALFGYAP